MDNSGNIHLCTVCIRLSLIHQDLQESAIVASHMLSDQSMNFIPHCHLFYFLLVLLLNHPSFGVLHCSV
jgi:hypothetical protein